MIPSPVFVATAGGKSPSPAASTSQILPPHSDTPQHMPVSAGFNGFPRFIWARCAPRHAPPYTRIMQDSPENYGGQPANLRSWRQAAFRGMAKKCPQCGRGGLFSGYTTTAKSCAQCGLDLTGHQADDAPPYLTILLVGHVTIPATLAMRQLFDPPMWLQYAIWLPMVLLAAFWILPVAKGGLIGIQWANRMHGFGDASANPDPLP